jgi:formate-dependent nitrite reductase membrane component NrfD
MVPLFNSISKESIHLSTNQNHFYIVWMDGRRFQRLAVYVEVDISDLKWIGVEIVAVVVAVLVFVIRREKAVYPMTFERAMVAAAVAAAAGLSGITLEVTVA